MATKYKRGRVWWGRAQREGREFRQSLKTADRQVAERRLREWIENLDAIAWGDRPRVPYAEAVRQFIEQHVVNLKPKSQIRYGVSMKWLADSFGAMYVDQIRRKHLADFETRRRAMGVGAPTIRRDLSCLSSILTFCEDREWIEEGRNPVPGYLRRRSKRGLRESPGRTRYLSEAEEAALIAQASETVARAVMLAIDTGLREQELFSLKWPQIDFRRGVITTTTDTKSGRSRVVPLAHRSAQFLERMRSAPSSAGVRSLYAFAHEDGLPFRNLTKGFKAAARRAKIGDVRWHDLRRTAGCRWRQRDGLPLEKVSILLGHSSYAVTEKSYAFLNLSDVAEGVAAQNSAQARQENT